MYSCHIKTKSSPSCMTSFMNGPLTLDFLKCWPHLRSSFYFIIFSTTTCLYNYIKRFVLTSCCGDVLICIRPTCPWLFIVTCRSRQYGFDLVRHHLLGFGPGSPRPRYKLFDDLDRSAMGPAFNPWFLLFRSENSQHSSSSQRQTMSANGSFTHESHVREESHSSKKVSVSKGMVIRTSSLLSNSQVG